MLFRSGKDARSRVEFAFRLATSRRPAADETKVLAEVFQQQWTEFRKDAEAADKLLKVGAFKAKADLDPAELAAWTTVASMILNLDETLTKS